MLRIACQLPGKWTSLIKQNPVNYFVAYHVTESLPQNFITQSNDGDVFTGVDLERRSLLDKYRGFWTYFEDENWYFIAFSFGFTSFQSRPRGSREFSFVIQDHRRKIPKKWLSLNADWLRLIFYCYLLTFGKLTPCLKLRANNDHWRMRSSHKMKRVDKNVQNG